MLNEILQENLNNLHYEKILENNENNVKSLINNINIATESRDQIIDFEEIGLTDYKQFLTIINNRVEGNFEEYNKIYGNEKEYDFISYEIDNLPEGFQIIDDFDIDEYEILNLGSINLIEKKDSIPNLQEFNREEILLEEIRYQNLPENRKAMIKNLVLKNKEIFWLEGDSLGSCNVEEHEINLTDNKPVYVKQFPLPHKLKEIAIEETQKLITNDVVRTSKSAFNAPAWIVAKKQLADGKKRWRLV